MMSWLDPTRSILLDPNDPDLGDPANGVEPGTAYDDLPPDWVCPECGAPKDQFEKIEE